LDKILVIDANARGRGKRAATLDVIGVGPRLIVSLLRSYGFYVELLPYESFIKEANTAKEFDVLAISYMVSDFEAVRKAIDVWHLINRDGLVVLGGPGTLDDRSLKRLSFDLAFKGEVEVTFNNIFTKYKSMYDIIEDAKDLNVVIPGLAIRLSNDVIVDGGIGLWASRDLINRVIADVDSVTRYPFYWASRIYVEVVRGCSNFYRPISTSSTICSECGVCRVGRYDLRLKCPIGIPPGCGYCSVPVIHGPARSRNLDSIIREVENLIKIGVTRIVLSAPDFLDYGRDLLVDYPLTDPCNPKPNIDAIDRLLYNLTSFLEVIEGSVSISIENVKPCLVTEDVVEILGRYLRDTAIYIGVESCSDKLLKAIGRPSTCNDNIKAIKLLSKYGLRPYIYLMHGLPFESKDDVENTLRCIDIFKEFAVEKIVLYRFTPLPRTAFSNFPKPKPAILNPVTSKLYRYIIEFNRSRKHDLLNKVIDVVIASKYDKNPRYLVSYPIRHGPVVLIRASQNFIGTIAAVRITAVKSDRLVYGELISIKKRLKLRKDTL